MITVPADVAQLYGRAQATRRTEITSWLGGTYLGEVPILSGTLTVTDDDVPGTLSITVPGRRDMWPTHPRHPLAAHGQVLRVRRAWCVSSAEGLVPVWWFDHGVYRVQPTTPSRTTIRVTAKSLEQKLDLARFQVPYTAPAGTYTNTLQGLLRGLLPLRVAAGVPNPSAGSRTWEEDRLGAVREVLSAWGVVGHVTPDRVFTVTLPPTGTSPAATLADGPGGTLVEAAPSGSGDIVPNGFITRSVPDDGSVPLTAAAVVKSGTRMWGGEYGWVPQFLASQFLKTPADLQRAADAGLAREQLRASQWSATYLSDDRIQRGDPIRIVSGGIPMTSGGWDGADVDMVARVTGYTIPLTPKDEPGGLTVSALSGTAYGQSVIG